jgi:uncharacterized membrane protein YeaQ/YmgE (transglycosylase-associated protein family)
LKAEINLSLDDASLYSDEKEKYNSGTDFARRPSPRSTESAGTNRNVNPGAEMLELTWAYTLLIGAVAGGISRYALPGRNPGGLVAAAMVGMAGSLVAILIGDKYRWYRADDLMGLAASAVGAFLFLAIFRFLSDTSEGAGGRQNYDL